MSGSGTKKAKDRKREIGTPKNQHTARGYRIVFWLSEAESDILEKKWPQQGFQNRSDYLRFICVHGVIDEVSIKFHVSAVAARNAIKAKGKGAKVDDV